MNTCPTCENSFKSKIILDRHIATAKYCLKKRNEVAATIFTCDYCDHQFTQKFTLNKHLETCINYINHKHSVEITSIKDVYEGKLKCTEENHHQEMESIKNEYIGKIKILEENLQKENNKNIMELATLRSRVDFNTQEVKQRDDIINDLTLQLEKCKSYSEGLLVPRPPQTINTTENNITTTINNSKFKNVITTTIQPLNQSLLEEHIPNFNLGGGTRGLAKYISNIFIKHTEYGKEQNYVSTDISRWACHMLTKKDPQEWTKDPGAQYICTILDSLIEEAKIQFIKAKKDFLYEHGDEQGRETSDYLEAIKKYESLYNGITDKDCREKLFSEIKNRIKNDIHIIEYQSSERNLISVQEPVKIITNSTSNLPKSQVPTKDIVTTKAISTKEGQLVLPFYSGKSKITSIVSEDKAKVSKPKEIVDNFISKDLLDIDPTNATTKAQTRALENLNMEIAKLTRHKQESTCVHNAKILTRQMITERILETYDQTVLSEGCLGVADYIFDSIMVTDGSMKTCEIDCSYLVFQIDARYYEPKPTKLDPDNVKHIESYDDRKDDNYQDPDNKYFSRLRYYRLVKKFPVEKEKLLRGVWEEDPCGSIINQILDLLIPLTEEYSYILDNKHDITSVEEAYEGIVDKKGGYYREQLLLKTKKRLEQRFHEYIH